MFSVVRMSDHRSQIALSLSQASEANANATFMKTMPFPEPELEVSSKGYGSFASETFAFLVHTNLNLNILSVGCVLIHTPRIAYRDEIRQGHHNLPSSSPSSVVCFNGSTSLHPGLTGRHIASSSQLKIRPGRCNRLASIHNSELVGLDAKLCHS